MKKILSALVLALTALCLFSCGNWAVEDNVPYENPQADDSVLYTPSSLSSRYSNANKTVTFIPGKILFKQANNWMYYNISTGECHRFCFDPSCNHTTDKCLSVKLGLVKYMTYCNGELYAAYPDRTMGDDDMSGIAKISLDASGMEIVQRCATHNAIRLTSGGGYLYLQELVGSRTFIYCYNTATGEFSQLKGKSDKFRSFFMATEDKIIYQYDKEPNLYCADHGMINEQELPISGGASIYSNNKLYYNEPVFAGNNTTVLGSQILCYNMETGKTDILYDHSEMVNGVWCVTDKYLYYLKKNEKSVYSDATKSDVLCQGILNRLDLETGEFETVFESPYLDFSSVFSVNGKLYAETKCYTKSTWFKGYAVKQYIYGELADFDGNGENDLEIKFWEWDKSETPNLFDIY